MKGKDLDKYDYLAKVVIIGNSAVGKTNILLRFTNQNYKNSHVSTIGVDFKVKTITIQNRKIKMQIWDTAGQQKYRTITQTYFKGASAVILVFSIIDRKSFQDIGSWIQQISQSQPEEIPKIIVGNKCDCSKEERQVTEEEGKRLASKYGVQYIECSAKQNINILQIFTKTAKDIKQKIQQKNQIPNKGLTICYPVIDKPKQKCEC